MCKTSPLVGLAALAVAMAAHVESEPVPPQLPKSPKFTVTGSGFQAGPGYFSEWIRSSVANAPRRHPTNAAQSDRSRGNPRY